MLTQKQQSSDKKVINKWHSLAHFPVFIRHNKMNNFSCLITSAHYKTSLSYNCILYIFRANWSTRKISVAHVRTGPRHLSVGDWRIIDDVDQYRSRWLSDIWNLSFSVR